MTAGDPATEPQRVWARLRSVFGVPRQRRLAPAARPGTLPFEPGREPVAAGAALSGLTDALGWRAPIAQGDLAAAWRAIAGVETARHASVEAFDAGTLLVRCDSTAWATQLGLMRGTILARIAADHPEAGITAVRFLGPNNPSWSHGPRSVQGRGPRDTYG